MSEQVGRWDYDLVLTASLGHRKRPQEAHDSHNQGHTAAAGLEHSQLELSSTYRSGSDFPRVLSTPEYSFPESAYGVE